MGTVVLPKLSQVGTNEWADVEDNDVALRNEINGNLDNINLKAAAAVAHSKLANGTAGQLLIANASGVITGTAMSGDVTITSGGVTSLAANSVLASEIGSLPSTRVTHSVVQAIAASTETSLAFNTERFDTDTMHDTVTNNSRLTATTAGVYLVTATVRWSDTGNTFNHLALRLNSTDYIAQVTENPASSLSIDQTVATIWKFAATDFVEVRVLHNNAGSVNINKTSPLSPEFAMTWLGDG